MSGACVECNGSPIDESIPPRDVQVAEPRKKQTEWKEEICFIDCEGELVKVQLCERVLIGPETNLPSGLAHLNRTFVNVKLARRLVVLIALLFLYASASAVELLPSGDHSDISSIHVTRT